MSEHDESHAPIRVEGPKGSLIQYCQGCEKVNLRWGNLMIPLELQRFEAFCDFFAESCERHFAKSADSELRFRFSELYLCFSPAEAEALLALVSQGRTEIFRARLERVYGLESRVGS